MGNGRNARNDLWWDTGPKTGLYQLGVGCRRHQTDDVIAASGGCDHGPGVGGKGFKCGLSPRKIQHLRVDMRRMENQISLVQNAAGFLRQQFRIRACDNGKGNLASGRRRGQMLCHLIRQNTVQIRIGILFQRGGACTKEEPAPECPAHAAHRHGICEIAKSAGSNGERSEFAWQKRFDIGLYGARKHRSRAFRANCDRDRIAVHDCGSDELAALKIINDICQRTVSAGQLHCACILGRVLVRCVEQNSAKRIARLHRTPPQGYTPLIRPDFDLGGGRGREYSQVRFSLQQQAKLGQCRIAAAGQNDAPPFQRDEDGKVFQGLSNPFDFTLYRK